MPFLNWHSHVFQQTHNCLRERSCFRLGSWLPNHCYGEFDTDRRSPFSADAAIPPKSAPPTPAAACLRGFELRPSMRSVNQPIIAPAGAAIAKSFQASNP